MIPIAKPLIGEEEKRAVLEVLDSGMLAQGRRVQAFEEAFAALCGVRHAVATSSGTTALHIALLAHGIGPGDEVITASFTFIASANAGLFTGARPVLVDIDPATFNIDPAQVEAAVTERTRAILPVHLFGLPCDMDPLREIAAQHGLALIEDACQAHGATYKGQPVGSFGTGCFSFYPTKNITTAEGGAVTTNDDSIAEALRLLRNHGMPRRYHHDQLGFNFRMTDVHAAIGLAQIGKLAQYNAARQANARYLSEHLSDRVVKPTVPPDRTHVFHQYTIRIPQRRDEIAEELGRRGIGTMVYYPIPVHQQTFYRKLGYGDVHLPETERASREVLSLPVHPALSEADLETIVREVNALC